MQNHVKSKRLKRVSAETCQFSEFFFPEFDIVITYTNNNHGVTFCYLVFCNVTCFIAVTIIVYLKKNRIIFSLTPTI